MPTIIKYKECKEHTMDEMIISCYNKTILIFEIDFNKRNLIIIYQ